tara:strand:- start:700 stop:1881 length:1182 start_codon:yes stop_codon:yes gene_type:complete
MAEEEVKQEGDFKLKKKKKPSMKKLNTKDNVTKVDLNKKEEVKDAVQEPSTTKVDVHDTPGDGEKMGETHIENKTPEKSEEKEIVENKVEDTPVIQEITDTEESTPTPTPPTSTTETTIELPENVEKLVDFMRDTGGTVEDYVRLNADYSNVNENVLLQEYYKQAKPHLDADEINFLMDDKFSYDEDLDEERDIRKKKLAKKEEIAKARNFLEETKSKYYDEIKLRPSVTQEQRKAMDFFNRYNKEQEKTAKQHEEFKNTTNQYFTNDFKGFDFKLGEKKFRYGVSNPSEVAQSQSNLSTFVKKFLNEDGSVKDYEGYHKAIFAARNADQIAKHFYDQGVADGTKKMVADSKNINNDSRVATPDDIFINGLKVKAINGVDSSKLKIKKRKFNT